MDALSLTRAIWVPAGHIVPVTIRGMGTVDQPKLEVMYPHTTPEPDRIEVRRCVERMFCTRLELAEFYRHVGEQTQWRELTEQFYGLRPILDANLFESMVRTIIGQQLNVQFAATLVERLVQLAGEPVSWNGVSFHAFPSPEQVARLSYEQLRAASFSQRKAEYVIDFARAIFDGTIDLEACWGLTDEQIHELLLPLRGIGRWTVECFLLFGMGRPDLMPAADIGVQNAIKKLYGMQERPREPEVRELAERWAPWRSYAAYYLWQSLIL